MDENMIQYIYGNTNAKVSHNRIRWNIKASTEVPTSETVGHLGDVIVVTSADIKKLKYVATNNGSEELQDNSINVYEDFTAERILVNESNGFDMYLFTTQQNIVLNGEVIIANVYFYDGLSNSWVQLQSAYREVLNLNTFTGQDLIRNLDEVWNGLDYVDAIDENNLLPTIIKPSNTADTLVFDEFSCKNIDVDEEWNGFTYIDTAVLRTSNMSEGDDVIIN